MISYLQKTCEESTERSLATQTQISRARRHAKSSLRASCLGSSLLRFLTAIRMLYLGFLSLAAAAFMATALPMLCFTRKAMAFCSCCEWRCGLV